MPARIKCEQGHLNRGMPLREAVIAISENRPVGECRRCGAPLRYVIEHTYANDPARQLRTYDVVRAVRLRTRLANGENYDPFLLVLRNIENGDEQILPTFWAFGRSGTQRGGQFPPLLSLEEWKELFEKLDPEFRSRDQ